MPAAADVVCSTKMWTPRSGGGFPAIWYTLKKARASGGILRMLRALSARNACKTCALGMGGQQGGMVNETGRFPEVCKKSVQAMAADMQGRVRPEFLEQLSLAQLERLSSHELEAAGRLVEPLIAECSPGAPPHYRPIPWADALDRIASALRAAPPERTLYYASGRASNEAAFLFQLFARACGTNNVSNCSYFCHQASGVALRKAIGSSAGTLTLDDLHHCDLIFIIGGNPASNHPRLMRTLIDLKRAGAKVVVINPLRELGLTRFSVPSDPWSLLMGSDIADEYLQPHIGGDIALLSALAKAVVQDRRHDEPFLAAHTDGAGAFLAHLAALSWPALVESSGVPEADLRRVAALYGRAQRAVFCWTMGVTHHAHGVDNVHAIANLALLRGMLGRPGAGLLPLRGHSNVQGLGTIGVTPNPPESFLSALDARFGLRLPRQPGLDTLAGILQADAGAVDVALHLGGNLFGSAPDAALSARALRRARLSVFLSTTLNTGHIHGRGATSIILPVRARDEESQPTTQESMFSFVRLSDGGPARHDGPRSEVEVIAELARLTLRDRPDAQIDWSALTDHSAIRQAIAATVPALAQLESIDRTGEEFLIPGRALHTPAFATPSGRAAFHPPTLPLTRRPGELRLMTIRSEGQFNTVVYEEHDLYRAQERRDVILMADDDMLALGLRRDDRVTVAAAHWPPGAPGGRMDNILVRPAPIRPGNAAMYCPEANALVPAIADPESRTPPFKNIPITVSRTVSLATLRS